MRLLDQTVKIFERAKHRVNLEVVHRVVAMVRIALENRAQVNGIDTEACNVFQLVLDTCEVSAEHVLASGLAPPRDKLAYGMVTLRTAKPIRQNLIEDCVFNPRRSEHNSDFRIQSSELKYSIKINSSFRNPNSELF